MSTYVGKAAKIAEFSGRGDISLLSIFPLEIVSHEKRIVKMSNCFAAILGFECNTGNTPSFGFPQGDIWDAVDRIGFTGYSVDYTPHSLSSSHELTLHYDAEVQSTVKIRARSGMREEVRNELLSCGITFPINGKTARYVESASEINIMAFNRDRQGVDGSLKTIPNLNE